MDTSKYITMFLQEVRENLADLNQIVVSLEREPSNVAILQEIMRLSHSSKSVTAAVGFQSTADLFHALEDVFDQARHGQILVDTSMVDLCFQALDTIESSLRVIEKGGKELECRHLTEKIRTALQAAGNAQSADGAATQPIQQDSAIAEVLNAKVDYIRVGTSKVEELTNLVGEMTMFKQQLAHASDDPKLLPLREHFEGLVNELNYRTIELRLVPLEQAFARFPRMVRDLCKQEGKKVKFEMVGADIELDKTLVDHLTSPLVHMLRNAIDHGIEESKERERMKKPPEGVLRILVDRKEGFAHVTVEDDGRPIDLKVLKETARKHGITEEELAGITEENVLDLLCDPRFSSKDTVSSTSGRGVGLSAVHETAKSLGGQLTLTQQGGRKQFTLSLPLQLSIFQTLLVQVAGLT